jgi:hypothetical protein
MRTPIRSWRKHYKVEWPDSRGVSRLPNVLIRAWMTFSRTAWVWGLVIGAKSVSSVTAQVAIIIWNRKQVV